MSGLEWQPDPEAGLEFARRAGYNERYVERMRQMQQHRDERQWPRLLGAVLFGGGVQLLLGVLRDHDVPTLQRYAVALVAVTLGVLAYVGFLLIRRSRRRARRAPTASRSPPRSVTRMSPVGKTKNLLRAQEPGGGQSRAGASDAPVAPQGIGKVAILGVSWGDTPVRV